MQCPVSAYLLIAVTDPVPGETPEAVLGRYAVSVKLRCSIKAGHSGNVHQAYYQNRLYNWLYPDPDPKPSVAVGDTWKAEGPDVPD